MSALKFSAWNEMGTVPPVDGAPMTVYDDGSLFFMYVHRTEPHGWTGGIGTTHGTSILLAGCVAFEEGTRWIRGHHDADSEQGAALLAARALLK